MLLFYKIQCLTAYVSRNIKPRQNIQIDTKRSLLKLLFNNKNCDLGF